MLAIAWISEKQGMSASSSSTSSSDSSSDSSRSSADGLASGSGRVVEPGSENKGASSAIVNGASDPCSQQSALVIDIYKGNQEIYEATAVKYNNLFFEHSVGDRLSWFMC